MGRLRVQMASHETQEGWPLLDERVLLLLAEDIGQAGVAEVVQLFLAEAPRVIDRLDRALVSRDRILLREVHTLASSASSVGLQRVGHLAAEIEHAMGTGDPSAAQLADLPDLLCQSVSLLAEWVARHALPEVGQCQQLRRPA